MKQKKIIIDTQIDYQDAFETFNAYNAEAKKWKVEGNWKNAIIQYKNALKIMPDHAQTLKKLKYFRKITIEK